MPINYIISGDKFEESLQAQPSSIVKVHTATTAIKDENSLGSGCFIKTLVTSAKDLVLYIANLQTLNVPGVAMHLYSLAYSYSFIAFTE